MFESYQQIFDRRAKSYHKAMLLFPEARNEEFEHLIRLSDIRSGQLIADIPCGGNYLSKYINENVDILGVEACFGFMTKNTQFDNVIISQPHNTGLKKAAFDRVLSLAGLHHMDDKTPYFEEVARLIKPSGKFCFADIAEHSDTSKFMDSIIHRFNSSGHEGRYLNKDTVHEIEQAGLRVNIDEVINFFWSFKSEVEMVEFCTLLFGMDQIDATDFVIEINKLLRPVNTDCSYSLPWQLRYISGELV